MRSTTRRASRLSVSSPTAAHLAAAVALLSCTLLLGSSVGCASPGSDAVSVAQVAVRANPDLELVATDERQAVLTVRVRRTGRILTVRADEVVAGTAFRDLNAEAEKPAQPSATVAEVPPRSAPAPAAGRRVEVTTPGARVSVIPPSGENSNPRAAAPVEPATTPNLSVETPAGTVSVERPSRAPLRGARQEANATPPNGVSQSTPGGASGARLDETALQKRTSPVQCAGAESVQLDGVLLQVERVAVQALGQCRVHITNSHLIGRVAVMAAGEAAVTIENSIIEGDVAIQAAGKSASSARSSTIRGRVQKLQGAVVNDLGQNLWR